MIVFGNRNQGSGKMKQGFVGFCYTNNKVNITKGNRQNHLDLM